MSGPEDNPADEHQPSKEEWEKVMGAKALPLSPLKLQVRFYEHPSGLQQAYLCDEQGLVLPGQREVIIKSGMDGETQLLTVVFCLAPKSAVGLALHNPPHGNY